MEKVHWVLAGVAGIGLFASGYLVGRPDLGISAEASRSPPRMPTPPNRQGPLASHPERPKAKPARRSEVEKHPDFRRIIDMVGKGRIRIDGVQINHASFLPDDRVGEFFGLSGEQLAEMKRLGLERLKEKQNREQSLATIRETSEMGIVFDLPSDPEFSATAAGGFVEDLSRAFGPEVAAMLRPSVEQAYGDMEAPRHVRYNLTRRDDLANLPSDAPEEIRAMHEGMHDFKLSVNQNEDGSYMTNEQGITLRGGGSSSGSINLNDTKPETYRPRYHYLWERETGRR